MKFLKKLINKQEELIHYTYDIEALINKYNAPCVIFQVILSGKDVYRSKIHGISALKIQKGEIIDTFERYLSKDLEKVNHIYRFDSGLEFGGKKELLKGFAYFIKDCILVSHDPELEMKVLNYHYTELGFKLQNPTADSFAFIKRWKNVENPTIQNLMIKQSIPDNKLSALEICKIISKEVFSTKLHNFKASFEAFNPLGFTNYMDKSNISEDFEDYPLDDVDVNTDSEKLVQKATSNEEVFVLQEEDANESAIESEQTVEEILALMQSMNNESQEESVTEIAKSVMDDVFEEDVVPEVIETPKEDIVPAVPKTLNIEMSFSEDSCFTGDDEFVIPDIPIFTNNDENVSDKEKASEAEFDPSITGINSKVYIDESVLHLNSGAEEGAFEVNKCIQEASEKAKKFTQTMKIVEKSEPWIKGDKKRIYFKTDKNIEFFKDLTTGSYFLKERHHIKDVDMSILSKKAESYLAK